MSNDSGFHNSFQVSLGGLTAITPPDPGQGAGEVKIYFHGRRAVLVMPCLRLYDSLIRQLAACRGAASRCEFFVLRLLSIASLATLLAGVRATDLVCPGQPLQPEPSLHVEAIRYISPPAIIKTIQ